VITSEELANALQNMVATTLADRVICDQSAIRLMVLEEELKFLRNQLQELQNESV
jgi:hypothetical protein